MKRLLFATLMMVCSVSWAKWETVGTTDSFTLLYDKSTIRRNREISQMWLLKNYFEVQTDVRTPFKSAKELWKYNCNEETRQLVSLTHFSESDGYGSVTFTYTLKSHELEWTPVAPGEIGKDGWEIACSKK